MKHRIAGRKLSRNFNERKALWNAQIRSMFIYGKIQTTEAKAKSVLSFVEKIASDINTLSDLRARRMLFTHLQDQTWVNNVMKTFKEVFGTQTSNFTKLTRIKRRYGDDALIVELAFVKPISFSKTKIVEKNPPTGGKKEIKK